MAVTDTRPAQDSDAASSGPALVPAALARPVGGLAGLLGTGDHKSIGRLYIGAALLFLAVAGVAGGLLGVERTDTGELDLLSDSFLQVFTLHSVSGLFLFLLPLLLGVAIYVVPLQVGARTVAFPRAAAASFWVWLVSGILLLASYAMNGGPFGGDPEGVDLWIVSLAAVTAALCLASVCVVTTVLALRTAGMSLDRVPLFSWSMVIGGSLWLLTLPVLFGLLILLYLDTRYGADLLGGSGGLYARMVWMFGPPQVYAFAIPALGVVADVVPVFSRARNPYHRISMRIIAVAGGLSFGAWTIAAIDAPRLSEQVLYVGMAFAIVPVFLALLGVVGATMRAGQLRLGSPLLFCVATMLLLLAGAALGAIGAVDALELKRTSWDSAQSHFVFGAGAVGGMGALHYWAPKLFGRTLAEGLGRLTALLLLAGFSALALADAVSGALDQPARLAADKVTSDIETLNLVSLAGGVVVVLAVLVFLVNLVGALARRRDDRTDAENDPWGGHTLEWLTSSPPPPGNFGDLPVVLSPAPLLDARAAEGQPS